MAISISEQQHAYIMLSGFSMIANQTGPSLRVAPFSNRETEN